jgi:hypothetical protein
VVIAVTLDTNAIAARRRAKNRAVGFAVAGFCALVFVISILRMTKF